MEESNNALFITEVGESLVIIHDGEELAITVNEIRGETVELGCAGPRSFVVLRAELTPKEEGTA